MKVLLANPPWVVDGKTGVRAGSRWPHLKTEKEGDYMPFPFFMAYAGALLEENGHDVLLIDAIAEGIDDEKFFDRVDKFGPELVLQEVSTPSLSIDLQYAKKTREKTDSPIALSGMDVNIAEPEFLKEHGFVDFALAGEYEHTLLDLVQHLDRGKPLKEVRGLSYRSNGRILKNDRRPLIQNLDELPWPIRDQLPMEKYEDRPGGIPKPSVQMIASRGCPYRCIFCAWPHMMYGGNSYRARSPKAVVDELEFLVGEMGFKSVYFDDDTFNIGKARIMSLCGEIKRRKIDVPWAAMARADSLDRELLTEMKSAGLRAIKYGVESGVQLLVDNARKSLDLEKVKTNVNLTKELDINTHLTFMFGLPGETKETIKRTLQFALELDPDSAQFSIATPFPGTSYFEEADRQGMLISKNWSDFDGNYRSVIRTRELTSKELEDARGTADRIWMEHVMDRRRYASNPPRKLFESCLREHGLSYTIGKAIDYLKKGNYRYYRK